MAILGRLCAGQDLTDEVYDGIRACAEFADDFELLGKARVGRVMRNGRGGKTYVVTLQKDTFTDKVARSENVFDGGGARCGMTGGGGTC